MNESKLYYHEHKQYHELYAGWDKVNRKVVIKGT